MTTPTPMIEARAFRIWQFAEPRDWNVTMEELAELTGYETTHVRYTIQVKRWGGRIAQARAESGAMSATSSLSNHRRGFAVNTNNLDLVDLML
jgi:hypothetical protein